MKSNTTAMQWQEPGAVNRPGSTLYLAHIKFFQCHGVTPDCMGNRSRPTVVARNRGWRVSSQSTLSVMPCSFACGTRQSTPMVQYMQLIRNRNTGRFELGNRGCDTPGIQVARGIVVEVQQQDSRMAASRRSNQVVK